MRIGGVLRVMCVLLSLALIYLSGRSSAGQDRIGWEWIGPAREVTIRTIISGRGSAGLFLLEAALERPTAGAAIPSRTHPPAGAAQASRGSRSSDSVSTTARGPTRVGFPTG
jgi:hypothetical protein